jgi:dethiobiotin synthetase
MIGCFVTGTDTGVGKTLVSAALLHALARHHPRVIGMKPVAAGVVRIATDSGDIWASEDAVALRGASTCQVQQELDNPYLLHDAVSPHIAAQRAGVQISVAHILACYQALVRYTDAVVVEGAGGFHVPLSEHQTGADLAQALALPVVLVVGLRLGCLNHALLTAEAIRARGLTLAGWVANHLDPAMPAQDENMAWLQGQLAAPLLGDIAFQTAVDARTISLTLPETWT